MGNINSNGKKLICSCIAILIAFCIALSVSGIVSSGVLKSQEFVAERLTKCNSILLEELYKKDEEVLSKYASFPVKVFTDTVGEGHIKTALLRTSGNLIFGYRTDFSESAYLYSYYKTGLTNYCKDNSIVIDAATEDKIDRDAALAVDVFNQVCGDESTCFVIPFQEAQSSDPIKVAIVCIIAIILLGLLLRRLNYGDYFMFSYGAMSIIIAGTVMVILPVLCLVLDYPSLFSFCDVEAFNVGIKYCIEDVLKILAITGAIVLLIGIITMNVVYNRYRNIVFAIQTEMEIADKLRKEYMEEQLRFEMEQGIVNNKNDGETGDTVATNDDLDGYSVDDIRRDVRNHNNLIDSNRNDDKN